jgi:putative heme iron utilization protein
MLRALEIQKAAFAKRGTRDEMITALAAARKEIWEIADSAPDENDGAQIGGLTRMLDHLEEGLNDPFWEVSEPPVDRQE